MNLNGLKKGLFGYKKESVYQYISSINEEFSHRLIEKDEKNEKHLKELLDKISELELDLSIAKKENETYQKLQNAVSNSIIDAQNYAMEMKNETKKNEMNLRKQAQERFDAENKKLDEFAISIEDIRSLIKETLKMYDSDLQNKLSNIKELSANYNEDKEENDIIEKGQRKIVNMSLFQIGNN